MMYAVKTWSNREMMVNLLLIRYCLAEVSGDFVSLKASEEIECHHFFLGREMVRGQKLSDFWLNFEDVFGVSMHEVRECFDNAFH